MGDLWGYIPNLGSITFTRKCKKNDTWNKEDWTNWSIMDVSAKIHICLVSKNLGSTVIVEEIYSSGRIALVGAHALKAFK